MPRPVRESTPDVMNHSLQTPRPATSTNSSFRSTFCDGSSHYLATPPSAVSDLPAFDLFSWRDAKFELPLDDRYANVSAPESPNSMSKVTGSCQEQNLWMNQAGTTFTPSAEHQPMINHVPRNLLLLDPADCYSGSASHGGTPTVSVSSRIDNVYTTRSPSLLAVEVDTSEYDIVQPEQWMYSVTEYEDDNATSPSSTDTHSSGPQTPADAQLSATFFPFQNSQAYDAPSFEQAHSDITTSFGSLSSTSSLPRSIIEQAHCTSTAASFGNLTFASVTSPQADSWPMLDVHASGNYDPHTHGAQNAGPGVISSYERFQGIQPTAVQSATVQPVFQPAFGGLQEFADASLEASPEACSDDESVSEVDDGFGEDMNDRALHDAQVRRDRDKYLLKMRHEGFSYKEIKRRGNFREAESTLRGRVRVLTKDKADRVRRPEWTEDDLRILHRAVTRFSSARGRSGARDGGRLPWKKISDYLVHNGSTYHFAAATCARKWKELDSR